MNLFESLNVQQWRLRNDGIRSLDHNVAAPEESQVEGDEPSEQAKPSLDPWSNLDWAGLQTAINHGQVCPSCGSENSLLGEGDSSAHWLFVVDAPSSADVARGQLLTGRNGELFEAMLLAIGLKRPNIYLTSVFKCAPTEDLSQSPQCNRLLQQQIELIQPQVVITFGEFVSQAVIRSNDPLERLRQEDHRCFSTQIPIVPTHSPATLLDQPTLKAQVWQDLQKGVAITHKPA